MLRSAEKKGSKEYTIIDYVTGIKNIHTYTHTHIKYKPWRKLGRILRGRCTRASRVPRGSIAGRGPWPMGTARWCPPEKHGWQFHSARGVEEIAPPPLNSSIARDERERGGRGARFAGWNSRRQKRAETGGSHTRAPFLSNFPAARANSTEFLSSSGTRFPSGFRPTDVATLCSQPPHLLPSPSPR